MNEPERTIALKERFFLAESIDKEGNYEKLEYREVEQLSFYIRVIREWFIPCAHCQQKLKEQLADGSWILGNKDYAPAIELNTVKMELDDDYTRVLEKHKATPEELKRIGKEGWEKLGYIGKPTQA